MGSSGSHSSPSPSSPSPHTEHSVVSKRQLAALQPSVPPEKPPPIIAPRSTQVMSARPSAVQATPPQSHSSVPVIMPSPQIDPVAVSSSPPPDSSSPALALALALTDELSPPPLEPSADPSPSPPP